MKKLALKLLLVIIIITCVVSFASCDANGGILDAFQPTKRWLDVSGRQINAHGNCVIYDEINRKYYWYGEDKTLSKKNSNPSLGVHAYSSTDLYNWTDEGIVLTTFNNGEYDSGNTNDWDKFFENPQTKLPDDAPLFVKDSDSRATHKLQSENYGAAKKTDAQIAELNGLYQGMSALEKKKLYRFWNRFTIPERPKVLYNEETQKYVMWLHDDGGTSDIGYMTARAGVAISDSPTGPFKFLGAHRVNYLHDTPSELEISERGMARDLGLFKDDDGTAYLFTSSENNRTMIVTKLSPDYTQFQSVYLRGDPAGRLDEDFGRILIDEGRESPAPFKHDGKYYMITSGLTGWAPNKNTVAVSDNIFGPYKQMGAPMKGFNWSKFTGANKTWGGQSSFVMPIRDGNGSVIPGKFIAMFDVWNSLNLKDSRYIWLPIEFKNPSKNNNSPITITYTSKWTLEQYLSN